MGHSKKSKHKKKNYSSSSSSSSGSEEEWVEMSSKSSSSTKTSVTNVETNKGESSTKRDDWMSMPGIIPCVSKEQINQERNRERKLKEFEEKDRKTYKPGESDRELNPYWKNGGTGVPEEDKKSLEPKLVNVPVGDQGLEWLRKALVRTQEQAQAEGRSIEDVAVERWGSLKKLYELIEEAEKQSKRNKEKSRSESHRENRHNRRREDSRDRSHRKRRSRSRDRRDGSHSRNSGHRSHRKHKNQDGKDSDGGDDRSRRRESQSCSDDSDNRSRRKYESRSRKDSDSSDDRPHRKRRSRSRSRDRRNQKNTTKNQDDSRKFKAPQDDDDYGVSRSFESKFDFQPGRTSTEGRGKPSWRKSNVEKKSSPKRRQSPEKERSPEHGRSVASASASSEVSEEQVSFVAETKVLTENEIAAKMMKAEIMGNDALVAKLKKQLEEARERNKAGGSQSQRTQRKEEVVVLTSTDKKGFTKPLSASENSYGDARSRRKKEKVVTHQDGKRQRYFADDDKYTLQNMFEREKLETVEDSNALFAKLAFKSKVGEDDSAFDMEDVFMEQASRKDSGQKLEEKQRSQAIAEHKRKEKVLDSCTHCLDSDQMLKHTIIDIGNKCYLSAPSCQSLSEGHCLIVPSNHVACATLLDEEVWEEIQNYRKKLTQLFLSQDEDVVFFETAMNFGRLPHMVMHCVPMPKEEGDMAPIYFKKAILECETEWSQNKKLVDLSQKNVRRAIPKGLPYFAVDFGLQGGFGHVIEDEKLFPRNFAQTIIGGMLDLDHSIWRKERPENFEDIRRKVVAFTKLWREFSKKEKS